ncbi:MAG: amidohydrolase [Saprospiraceae bacterium]
MLKYTKGYLLLLLVTTSNIFAQDNFAFVSSHIDAKADLYASTAQQIWNWAELGYQENQSSQALQQLLRAAGFRITSPVADIPTAFVAEYGFGKPVIGLLGEYDALPGVSQAAVPHQQIQEGSANGHACGHHLFGTASVAAAIAVKEWMEAHGQQGTIRFYGTPAEEGGAGKVYMVRAGLFEGVDAVLHWHPGMETGQMQGLRLLMYRLNFVFTAKRRAAAAPCRGRSALDGVEAMNYMVNLMREHITPESRIHYVITKGGEAPNVIPAFAEAFYYVQPSG